jgi:hypothetical protein
MSGALYGTTGVGGCSSCCPEFCCTVFKLTPPATLGGTWTETTLHRFGVGSDGVEPLADLIADKTGALYGTTFLGGALGSGTAFKLTPPATVGGAWTEGSVSV